MKLLREFLIILTVYLIGDYLAKYFLLPIPGNIIGMLIMLLLLIFKVVKLEWIETVSQFFLNYLAFFFIPVGVALITSIAVVKDSWVRLLLICILSTVIVIVVTGLVVQFLLKRKHNKSA